jgi:hypothetical protein
MLWQAGVLGSQPSVPVIALTGDGAVCALAKLIASQEMLWLGDQMQALASASRSVPLAILRPDPGDDFPDVIFPRYDLTIGGHRPNNILGSFAHEALLLKGVPGAKTSGAERDEAEQSVIIAPVDPNLVCERCRHAPSTTTAMTPAAVVRLK